VCDYFYVVGRFERVLTGRFKDNKRNAWFAELSGCLSGAIKISGERCQPFRHCSRAERLALTKMQMNQSLGEIGQLFLASAGGCEFFPGELLRKPVQQRRRMGRAL
jgi:hypothetical protein